MRLFNFKVSYPGAYWMQALKRSGNLFNFLKIMEYNHFLHAGLWSMLLLSELNVFKIITKKLLNNNKQHQATPNNFQITNQHFQKTPNLSKKNLASSRGCFFNFGSFPRELLDVVFKRCWYLFDFLRYSM